jgi:hypothetical protein
MTKMSLLNLRPKPKKPVLPAQDKGLPIVALENTDVGFKQTGKV